MENVKLIHMNKPIVTVLENNTEVFHNICRMLEHNGAACIAHLTPQTHVIIANVKSLPNIRSETRPVILYGVSQLMFLEHNFTILPATASVFEIHVAYNRIKPHLQQTTPTPDVQQSNDISKMNHEAFVFSLKDMPVTNMYAMVEYFHKLGMLDIKTRTTLYSVLNEIVEVENGIVNNINTITFNWDKDVYYLSVDYSKLPTRVPLLLYVLNCKLSRTFETETFSRCS